MRVDSSKFATNYNPIVMIYQYLPPEQSQKNNYLDIELVFRQVPTFEKN